MSARNPLAVIPGGGGPVLRRANVAPRLRPGDYPVWFELTLGPVEISALRRRAHERGLGVDAMLALALEYQQVVAAISPTKLGALKARAEGEGEVGLAAIAAYPEVRDWRRLLEGKCSPPGDELPAVCVGLRTIGRVPAPERTAVLLRAASISEHDLDTAVALELAATHRGMTIDFWALSQD